MKIVAFYNNLITAGVTDRKLVVKLEIFLLLPLNKIVVCGGRNICKVSKPSVIISLSVVSWSHLSCDNKEDLDMINGSHHLYLTCGTRVANSNLNKVRNALVANSSVQTMY